MQNTERVIVTKRRYNGFKALMIIFLFSVEFYFMFMDYFKENERSSFALAAYVSFAFIFIGKTNSSKSYLKYEYILGLIIKSAVMNVVIWLFMVSLDTKTELDKTFFRVLMLLVLNVLSILLVFIVMNIYTKFKTPQAKRILHIYPEDIESTGNGIEQDLEVVKQKIDDYEYVYLHNLSSRARKRLLKYCYEHDKVVYCTSNLSDVLLRASGLTQDIDTPVYYCTSFGVGGVSAMLKRAFDIGFSFIFLILTSPVMLVVAVAIKLEDHGCVIYKQRRCTKDMKEFTIYKFRSMKEDSEGNEAKLAVSDDERLTAVGRIIRKFKIDEFPQFFNILKGDMSVVGPRPERPELIKEAVKNTPEFILRTKVKAGLTGYAQVRGYYNTGFKEKLLWDLMYIEQFSLILDLKIIMMTVITVFSENIRDD